MLRWEQKIGLTVIQNIVNCCSRLILSDTSSYLKHDRLVTLPEVRQPLYWVARGQNVRDYLWDIRLLIKAACIHVYSKESRCIYVPSTCFEVVSVTSSAHYQLVFGVVTFHLEHEVLQILSASPTNYPLISNEGVSLLYLHIPFQTDWIRLYCWSPQGRFRRRSFDDSMCLCNFYNTMYSCFIIVHFVQFVKKGCLIVCFGEH